MTAAVPQIIGGAIVYEAGFAVDADGSPRAYALPGSGLHGLDSIDNAGAHGRFWGVVCNSSGVPIVQGPDDPAPGFCVSPTSLIDSQFGERDPRRYVDSEHVPYIAVPPDLTGDRGVRMGDVAVAILGGLAVGAVVADVGPHGHYGEGSIALADALGIDGRGQCRGRGLAWGVTWIVWPRSHATPAWPRPVDDVQKQAMAMLSAWGGMARVPWLAPNV